jgi:hypothetical protein
MPLGLAAYRCHCFSRMHERDQTVCTGKVVYKQPLMQRATDGNLPRVGPSCEAAHPAPETINAAYVSGGYPQAWSSGPAWPIGGQRVPPYSDPRSSQCAMPAERQYMSAVPMGVHVHRPMATPLGTSPQQAGGMLSMGTMSHAHLYGAVRASPCHQQPASGPMHIVKIGSPARSDVSSHLGLQSSPHHSSGFSASQSPRSTAMRPPHALQHHLTDPGPSAGAMLRCTLLDICFAWWV